MVDTWVIRGGLGRCRRESKVLEMLVESRKEQQRRRTLFLGIFENGNTSIAPGPPGYFGEAKYSTKINSQLMSSIAMDSNAYQQLEPN
jgi:hypothetical protein